MPQSVHAISNVGILPEKSIWIIKHVLNQAIQVLYAEKLKSGPSSTMVNFMHIILHKALDQAVKWDMLLKNPADAVTAPKEVTPEFTTWTPEQATRFSEVADQHEWATLWRLASTTGMRRGQILGLRWQDVDLLNEQISIRRTLSRGVQKGGLIFGEPKSQSGKRVIALPQSLVEILARHNTLGDWYSVVLRATRFTQIP